MIKYKFDTNKTLEVFRPLYETKADIVLLWGGRDFGKSDNLARVLVRKCMKQSYFKCILLREYYDDVIDSNYAEIESFIVNNKLEHLFTFTKRPAKITYKPNGNSFVGRGGDKPRKLKGIKHPTDLWAEEGDTIKEDTIDMGIGSLRTNAREDIKTQAWITFNPEVLADGSMMLMDKYFYPHNKNMEVFYNKQYEWSKDLTITYQGDEIQEQINFLSIHGTCDDNPYCPPSKIAFYDSFKGVDENKYNVWRLGRLGQKQNENPFFKSDETDKFVYLDGQHEVMQDLPLRLSFDFNNDPCTVVICQLNLGEVREKPPGLYILETIQVKGGTELLADELIVRGIDMHRGLIEMTGDNSGRARKSNSLHSDVDILERKMRARFHTNRKVNELLKESRITVNYWLVHGKTFIYKYSNAALIKDLKTGEIDEKGGIKKDRNSHPQDAGDAFRYIFPEWLGATVSDLEKVFPRLRKAQAFWDKYKDHFK